MKLYRLKQEAVNANLKSNVQEQTGVGNLKPVKVQHKNISFARFKNIFNRQPATNKSVKLTGYQHLQGKTQAVNLTVNKAHTALFDHIFGQRKPLNSELKNWHFGSVPAAYAPTPNDMAVEVVNQVLSQYYYCQDGVIGIKHSQLQAAIAINHQDKKVAVLMSRKHKNPCFKSLFNVKNSQQDYLHASIILNLLHQKGMDKLSGYQLTLVTENAEAKLANYAASRVNHGDNSINISYI